MPESSLSGQNGLAGGAAGNGYYRHVYDIKLAETHLWEIGSGNLYDVKIKFVLWRIWEYVPTKPFAIFLSRAYKNNRTTRACGFVFRSAICTT